LRQLYATGLYETIEVLGTPGPDRIDLVFRGTPRVFIGTVSVYGAKGATLNTQLERVSQLSPGEQFTQAKLDRAFEQMQATLASNGFHSPKITDTLTSHPAEQLVDISFAVTSGPQARVGKVEVSGDPGMTSDEFRHFAHLRTGAHVDHDTSNRALTGVLKHYQKEKRLEADVKLAAQQYAADVVRENFQFAANQGPVVKVLVEGAKIGPERLKRLIPIFQEGTVDEDLLNEGSRRLRDYYQRLGYFDVRVDHERQSSNAATGAQVVIVYKVQLGPRRRVEKVSIAGNHYFDTPLLMDLLSVHAANTLDRHGAYSQALVSADIAALQAVYRNNGFAKVKIVPETSTPETGSDPSGATETPASQANLPPKTAPLALVYRIEEGPQTRVSSVRIDGNTHTDAAHLTPLLNTTQGQLLSPQNLAGDRDAIFADYLSRGFLQARVEVVQQPDPSDASQAEVTFHITEGQQTFVRNVLLTGLQSTRRDTVASAITLHPGDPLNETALMDTQRNLYEFALFSEVDAAVENPAGSEEYKTVLLQAVEARRWALTYGFGFEAQTGTPQNNCQGAIAGGVACNPNGKTGVSPRVIADVTRNGLFGRDQSASIRGTYGLLEQRVDLLFQNPRFEGDRNFGLTLSAGYANSQDVTTYVASRLQAGVRFTEGFQAPGSVLSKANTFVYEYNFRRVKVAASSLQVYPGEISTLATAVRVAGPSVTWIRDTRDSPLDAHRGSYTSLQEFLSFPAFGAQSEFNRIDVQYSSFYAFDKRKYVLARNTRYGQIRAFKTIDNQILPLPERLYAGGPISLRGFSVNAAGPRDPETGYPIGGAGALVNSTELRLPPPTLPWIGSTVSFVLFHDMGNVFTNAGDAWPSAIRVRQPDRDTCKNINGAPNNPPITTDPVPNGPTTSTGTQGQCSFNYFSHAPGVGLRYHTPVGPLRFDFSYNLNPPIYPVNINYSLSTPDSQPHVGEANHFNFFFSLGQTF
jgi:outer membrane protein assembly complex protein YaeT